MLFLYFSNAFQCLFDIYQCVCLCFSNVFPIAVQCFPKALNSLLNQCCSNTFQYLSIFVRSLPWCFQYFSVLFQCFPVLFQYFPMLVQYFSNVVQCFVNTCRCLFNVVQYFSKLFGSRSMLGPYLCLLFIC